MSTTRDLPIHVYHPRTLGTWSIEAQRLNLGEGYKPSLALLPDGELVLVLLDHTGDPAAGTYTESMPLRRSTDGGRAWTEPLRNYLKTHNRSQRRDQSRAQANWINPQ